LCHLRELGLKHWRKFAKREPLKPDSGLDLQESENQIIIDLRGLRAAAILFARCWRHDAEK
jgi:hypothetical protein